MTERTIVEAAARLRRQGEPYLVATVVCVTGSAYRRPGARMLLTRFRWIAGSVSGGCLEGDISTKGWWRTQNGSPVVVRYDSRVPEHADDDDVRAAFGLGCDGVVEVMLERAGTGAPSGRIDPLELANECTRTQRRAAVATVFRSELADVPVGARIAVHAGGEPYGDALPDAVRDALAAELRGAVECGRSATRSIRTAGGTIEACIEALLPPPRLFVLGTGHDAVPVVDAARALGWDVVVATPRPRVSIRQRFAHADDVVVATPDEIGARIDECDRAMAIVMSHNYELDRAHLGALVASRARYIGVLGPRARTTRMSGELGLPDGDSRVHAPLGLELGAETPQEIALAAIAEIQAVLARSPGASLRDRIGPIHDRPTGEIEPAAAAG
ncbi:MAG TPA: XdhC family protein [Kofleriaceae bacterium]|jgi:xanthine/CO dehydrogenase XdhC/CoxF family maturation factor